MPAANYAHESGDEPRGFSIFGNNIWYSHGGDGADTFGYAGINVSRSGTFSHIGLYGFFGDWYKHWPDFKYGNGNRILLDTSGGIRWWASYFGTHGLQPAITPLNGRVYLHRSNAVISMQ